MYPHAHTHTHAHTHFQETRQASNRGGAHLFVKKMPHIKKVGHALNTTKSFNKPRFLYYESIFIVSISHDNIYNNYCSVREKIVIHI